MTKTYPSWKQEVGLYWWKRSIESTFVFYPLYWFHAARAKYNLHYEFQRNIAQERKKRRFFIRFRVLQTFGYRATGRKRPTVWSDCLGCAPGQWVWQVDSFQSSFRRGLPTWATERSTRRARLLEPPTENDRKLNELNCHWKLNHFLFITLNMKPKARVQSLAYHVLV